MINNVENEKYYSPDDLAKKFGISLSSVYKLIKAGKVPHIRLGKVYRVPASGLQKFLGGQEKDSKTTPSRPLPKVIDLFLNRLKKSELSKNISAVWLYGSYARGDYDLNSDIDLLIVLKNKDLEFSNILTDITEKAMKAVHYEDILSLYELDEKEWTSMKKNKYRIAQIIETEGRILWKTT